MFLASEYYSSGNYCFQYYSPPILFSAQIIFVPIIDGRISLASSADSSSWNCFWPKLLFVPCCGPNIFRLRSSARRCSAWRCSCRAKVRNSRGFVPQPLRVPHGYVRAVTSGFNNYFIKDSSARKLATLSFTKYLLNP